MGKVFVKFFYIKSAKRCRYKLNGRIYDGRSVIATYFPEDDFEKGRYMSIIALNG